MTRITHQSIGPRVGRFAEEMIKHWIDTSGIFEKTERDVTLSSVLKSYFGMETRHKNKIDFFMKRQEKAFFVELRMSEHTGGKTGQESLLDKFNKVLDLAVSGVLIKRSLERGVRTIELIVAILFNENQEIIDKMVGNFNVGRLNSLINYMMENHHIRGRVSKLNEHFTFCDGKGLSRNDFENALRAKHEVCIKHRERDFQLCFRILLGNDFFSEISGVKLDNLVAKYGEIIADDLWIMYSLVLNELEIANMFGRTNSRDI